MSTIFHYLKFITFLLIFINNLNAQTVTYSNSDNTRNTSSFEACLGDQITFNYQDFSANPDELLFTNGNNPDLLISLTSGTNIAYSNTTTTNNNTTTTIYNGTITITIPSNLSTGQVSIIANNQTLYNFNNSLLIIHKPAVNFYFPPAPFCATDTIPLIGVPAGGVFSASPSNLISNSSLIGMNAAWSTSTNDSIKDVSITYAYTPKYISGHDCSSSIDISKIAEIRDNRFDTLEYQYIITSDTPTVNDRVVLDINSSIVQKILPDFSAYNYPVNFAGNYVNQVNGADVFFIEDAGYDNHPISLQYNNGGCIGELTANLDVLQPLQLSGIVDTLCKSADSITIRRDSRPEYAYTDITINTVSGTRQEEQNIILSVYAKDSAYNSAITLINSIINQEEYTFNPNSNVLPPNLDSFVIVMEYIAYRITTIDNGVVFIDQSPISTIEYPIKLVNQLAVNFTLDPTYCKNSRSIYLAATPSFHAPYSSFTYTSSTSPSGPFTSQATNLQNNEFNPNAIYAQSVSSGSQNQDLHLQLTYTVDRYGCVGSFTQNTKIDSIPDATLNGLAPSYCINSPSVQLSGLPINSTATYKGSGITDTLNGTFSPSTAGLGTTSITYSVESGNGCKSSVSQTTTINATSIPRPSFPQSQYCASDPIVALDTSYTYWGTIIDSTNLLNPENGAGQQTVFFISKNNLDCSDTSSTIILINPLPVITINSLDSAYCFNGPVDNNIFISPPVPNLGHINGSSLGFNFNSAGGVTFDPDFDSSGVKSFKYKYTDNLTNCSDSVSLNITVYDVPTLSHTGIQSSYCSINYFDPIAGIPSGGIFDGLGVLDTMGQYHFNPSLSGGGSRLLNYSIIDVNPLPNSSDTLFCPANIDIPVVINPLPLTNFSGPGNSHSFCSNEADTILNGIGTSISDLFTSTTPNAINRNISFVSDTSLLNGTITWTPDTSFIFSPNNAGGGVHHLTYTATDKATGCQDSTSFIYYITDYAGGASFQLKPEYCAASDPIILSGAPSGGTFLRNQDTLHYSSLNINSSIYLLDTITYQVTYGACTSSDTQFVEINPLLDLSFVGNKPSKIYCIGEENTPLSPNVSGGTFNGNGILYDSIFTLQYASIGDNIITYTYVEPATGCESFTTDTLFVFNMPIINFSTIGSCQLDSIFFHPDNSVLNLDSTSGTSFADSITNITWELEPGTFITGNRSSNTNIDSIHHIYTTPGIYHTKLSITNRTYCVDTSSVRVVISPTITSNQFPYDESFENSNGNWYAEAKDSTHNLLWEWGTDTIHRSINEPNNNIWATQLNDQYQANEAAWVYSPCFDISSLERPMIQFDHWSDTRNSLDGTVLEFQDLDGTWSPMGELNRGINWFNTGTIAGSPGNQTLSPTGWSGESNRWVNSRYKLDEFRNTRPAKLHLRMAFGSSSINLGTFHNGFAFDNVWIGSRTRNVLLETTSNINEPNMDYINNYVYQLVYHSNINKDVILLQYHSETPNNNDAFHQYNTSIPNARTWFYGIYDAGTAFIDGINHTRSELLTDLDFEQDMLESPKFKVEIDTFYHTNPGQFTLTSTVTALVNIPTIERYRINMVITEDSLSYASNGAIVHAVVRKDDSEGTINTFDRSWAIGDQVTFTEIYSTANLNYVPNHFQAVVFIQSQEHNAREVFQAATTRDVHGYWVGVDQVSSEKELNEIKDITLYPNPARDYINIDFPEALKKDYNWKLISIGGITVKEAVVHAGEQSLTINNYDLPSGVYIFMVYNDNVYSQRKVMINQN
jgi:hypothetical protein